MIQLENYHFGERLSFSHYHPVSLNYTEHLHRSFEMLYCKKGEVSFTFNQAKYTLTEGEATLILPYHLHEIQTPEYSEIDIFIFSPEYVEDFYAKLEGMTLEIPVFMIEKELYQQLYPALYETDCHYYRKSGIYQILYLLEQQTRMIPSKNSEQMITQILLYIEAHFKENLTLEHLSEFLGYSNVYVSKTIANRLKSSFPKLLNNARVNHACYLLISTNMPITSISDESGFQNPRTFNRNFQSVIGITPKDYRRKNRN